MKILNITSRTISLELDNNSPYYAADAFDIFVNQQMLRKEFCNVFTIYDLEPNHSYTIEVLGQTLEATTLAESVCLNVQDFYAFGDGKHDDTVKIQAAIACCPKNGTVFLPEGTYLISCLFLKSDMTLYLSENAKIIAKYQREDFPILPGKVGDYSFGTWEGSEVSNFASTITAIGARNLTIAGNGEIDEQATLGDWYHDHRNKRIAWRGFGMYLKDCEHVNVVGIYIHNSPSWNVHPYFSNHLNFINLKIENLPSMPTTDGLDPDCCSDVLIAGCHFSVGDDCIAIKSGTIDLAKKYRRPCQNLTIRNNLMEQGHGGVVFGSESSGGIKNVVVSQCVFRNTDRGLRIKTRRGRGRVEGIDNVDFSNILMDNVPVPFVINMYYNMGPAGGHEEYVWTTKPLLVDERTPLIGNFTFKDMICRNISYAAGVFLGLPEEPIRGIEFKNVSFHFKENAEAGYPVMIEHKEKMLKKGLYCLNVDKVQLENVTFDGVLGEQVIQIRTDEEK